MIKKKTGRESQYSVSDKTSILRDIKQLRKLAKNIKNFKEKVAVNQKLTQEIKQLQEKRCRTLNRINETK